jgi:hypothetical protein
VTLKENASADELTKAKEKAKSDGGEIKHEFTLIKGFTSVRHPRLAGQLLTCTVSSSLRIRSESCKRTSTSTLSKMGRSGLSEHGVEVL